MSRKRKTTRIVKPPESPAPLVANARAQAVFKTADGACRELTSATFDATYEGGGVFAQTVPRVRGAVSFDAAQEGVGISGSATSADDVETQLEQASNAEHVVTIDQKNKRYVYGGYPFARGLLEPGIKLQMAEFGHEAPFTDELEGGSKYEGTEEISGAVFDVVYVMYKEGRQAARWFIAQEGDLPRRVERV